MNAVNFSWTIRPVMNAQNQNTYFQQTSYRSGYGISSLITAALLPVWVA
jgi:hypothetical protein